MENPIIITVKNCNDFVNKAQIALTAVNKGKDRPALTLIKLQIQGSYIELTSTDGFRLSQLRIELENMETPVNKTYFIEYKILESVISFIKNDLKTYPKRVVESVQLSFQIGENSLILKLVDNTYNILVVDGKDYPTDEGIDRIIPKDFNYTVRLNRKYLMEYLKEVKDSYIDISITDKVAFPVKLGDTYLLMPMTKL